MIKPEDVINNKNDNKSSKENSIQESSFKKRLKDYLRIGEYILLAILLFVLAITFWYLTAQLYKVIKQVEKIRNS